MARTRIACPWRRCRFTCATDRELPQPPACSTTIRRRLNAVVLPVGGRAWARARGMQLTNPHVTQDAQRTDLGRQPLEYPRRLEPFDVGPPTGDRVGHVHERPECRP